MKQPTPQPKQIHIGKLAVSRKLLILLCIGIVAVPVLLYLYNYSFWSPRNYAEEVAKPLEEALVKAGGVKKSSYGEAGRVSDNRQPYYDAIYDFSTSKANAATTINRVAEDNGYRLEHASSTNRGFLGVADIYLDAWYFDTANKSSTFADLEDGPIRLSFKLGDEDAPDQAGHTTVRLSIQLPGFKQ